MSHPCDKVPERQRGPCYEAHRPSSARKIWNFVGSAADHITGGLAKVTEEEKKARLTVCNSCELHQGNACLHPTCGCNLEIKAGWKEQQCPLGKWPGDGMKHIKWVWGITTVPQRLGTTLPRTLASLKAAGFENPRLFIDGATSEKVFGLETTCHNPKVNVHGNWILSMMELLIRDPVERSIGGNRYALFQDDLVASKNLRQYLEQCKFPEKGYWNLYTFPENQRIVPSKDGVEHRGWYLSDQFGKSALGLIFDREGLLTLLSSRRFVERPLAAVRGTDNVDGGIIMSMKQAGYQEWVHNPSLLQHTGDVTSKDRDSGPHPKASSFQGENFDCMELLKCSEIK